MGSLSSEMINAKVRVVSDVENIKKALEIRRIVFQIGQNVDPKFDDDGEDFKTDSCKIFLAEINERPAGTCRIRIVPPFLKVERLAVLEEYRKIGIGKELMNFAQNFACQHLPNLLPKLLGQLTVFKFYSELGWITLDDTVIIEQNMDHYFMIYPPKTISLVANLEIIKFKDNASDYQNYIDCLEKHYNCLL